MGLAFALVFGLFGAAHAASAVQGDRIDNVATASATGMGTVTSTPATVHLRIATPAKIELLEYAPQTPGSANETVALGTFQTGGAAGSPFAPLGAPQLSGAAQPLTVPGSLPLLMTKQFHQGDPVFIRVTDLDRNMDRVVRETVDVAVTNDLTGDSEVVRLTEDGADTGTFVGYLPTARSAGVGVAYDGVLQAIEKSTVTARYVDTTDPGDAVQASAQFDPISRVFDSRTGKPVSGAEVTVIDMATGQPATVFSDDGVTSFPSTVTSGGTVVDGSGRKHVFGDGEFRFPYLHAGTYQFRVKAPVGYSAPSKLSDSALQNVSGAPFALDLNGSYGKAFVLDPGPSEHIDIPVDPGGVALWVQKRAAADQVGIGDNLGYEITVTNPDPTMVAPAAQAVDLLPAGFRYRKGSTQVDGVPGNDPTVAPDGKTLTFFLGDVRPGVTRTIRFVVQIGSGAQLDTYAVNRATARSIGGLASNVATAQVRVADDFFAARSFVLGRVTTGPCDTREGVGHDGVAGVRVVLEDGTFALSDKKGLFHFEGLKPGTHVVQLDLDSVPEGYEAFSCTENDRFAGRAFSQFVEVKGDVLWRADFHLRAKKKVVVAPPPPPKKKIVPPPPPPPPAAPPKIPPGTVVTALTQTKLDRLKLGFELHARGSNAPLSGAEVVVTLPETLKYVAGSATVGGEAISEPRVDGNRLVFPVGQLPPNWEEVLAFQTETAEDAPHVDGSVVAQLQGTGVAGNVVATAPAETVVRVITEQYVEPLRLLIHPHFATLGTDLSAGDKKQLADLAKRIRVDKTNKIIVVGHTDSQKIRKTAHMKFADNKALSLARAESVRKYLLSLIAFGSDQIEADGKGETEPVADNKSADGRAQNRRVEVQAFADDVREHTALQPVKPTSGEHSIEVPALAPAPSSSARTVMKGVVLGPLNAATGNDEWSFGSGDEGSESSVLVAPGQVEAAPVESAVVPGPVSVQPSSMTAAPGTASVDSASAVQAAAPATDAQSAGTVATEGAAAVQAAAPSSEAQPANPVASAQDTSSAGAANGQGAVVMQPPTPAPEVEAPKPDGFVSPIDGDLVPDRTQSVQIRLSSGLTPQLAVDGVKVDSSRIGWRGEDKKTGQTVYTYVGVDLGDKGTHVLTLTGSDPFGNARVSQTAKILRTGEIVAMKLVEAEHNVADGKTPVRARIQLIDASGNVIHGAMKLEVLEGNLRAYHPKDQDFTVEDLASGRKVQTDRDGVVLFDPVTTSGSYHAVLTTGTAKLQVETWVQPKMRDWILVGLAEGTAGYNVLSGNLQTLKESGQDENFYDNGRLAFYAKGQVQGKWLVTAAYDSSRTPNPIQNRLFQQIDPNSFFTLYGDSSQQDYDAASVRKIYVKIERSQFYALFGDFDTGLTVTELSRYSRKLNGFKAELQTKHAEVNAFAARSDQAYTHDEIPGDGTSGLYRLSRGQILPNSETVTLITRDRYRSEVLVTQRVLTRYIDYSIDYDQGSIFFREPVPSRDEAFNPITIVVEYESQLTSDDNTAGGRAGVKLFDDRVRAGVTMVHEGLGSQKNNLLGGDVKVQVAENTVARAEVAGTDSRKGGVSTDGYAFLAELTHQSKLFDGQLYWRDQQSGFGMGQQLFSETGTRKWGGEGAYHFTDHLSFSAEAYRQDTFSTGVERLFGEARVGYLAGPYSAYFGLLEASDRLRDDSHHDSGQLLLGGKWALARKLTLGLEYAQSAWGDGNIDYPSRVTASAEYKLTEHVSAIAAEDVSWGGAATTNNTRIGLRSTPWEGGTITTSVERDLQENANRVFGNIGLHQTWQLSESWKVDLGGERSQTVKHSGFYVVNPTYPNSGGNNLQEDFTAVSGGATYQHKRMIWDSRAELRDSASDLKWSLISGAIFERDGGWAYTARAEWLGDSIDHGARTSHADLRLGAVYRPENTHWILLDRLDWVVDRSTGANPVALFQDTTGSDSWRVVNNLLGDWRPRKDVQLSLGVGLKYVKQLISNATDSGFVSQLSAELRKDLVEHWDVGLDASVLEVWSQPKNTAYAVGPSVGYSPAKNLWLGVGFNVAGYHDVDFSQTNYTDFGPWLRLRFKFDQQSIREAASWLNKQ